MTDNTPTAVPEENSDVREALALAVSEGNPPDRIDYSAADAILAAFEVRPYGGDCPCGADFRRRDQSADHR